MNALTVKRGWRFWPLADEPKAGVLVSPESRPVPAIFLTVAEARDQHRRSTNT